MGIEDGEITPVTTPYQYEINMASSDIKKNEVNQIVGPKKWDLNQQYSVVLYCKSRGNYIRHYAATSTMPPSATRPGFLVLNDYFDVKVEVFVITGPRGQGKLVTVPFDDQPNNLIDDCFPPSITSNKDTMSGSKGQVTFILKKKIINGLNLQGVELVKVYGGYGRVPSKKYPLSIVMITSGIITVPDKCTVNEGTPIVIPFDDIPSTSTLVNGKNYSKNFTLRLKCDGGSFSDGDLNIKLGIQPAGSGLASFDPRYLGTTGAGVDRSNLGVVISDKSGNTVIPNHFYRPDKFQNNRGEWKLTAAPIAKPGSEIPEGEYESNASVVAEFQ